MSLDLVIRNGTVYDGTGAEGRTTDVALSGGKVVAVGPVAPADAFEIDARGLVVAPGFIDIHSHSDFTLLVDPRAVSAIHQGVTTEVVGNCGFGCFPIRDPQLARRAIYGYNGDLPLAWTSADGYFNALQAARPTVNVLSLVPNGQLRLSVVGLADRPATADETSRMAQLLRESIEAGAWGYSTGLEYPQESAAPEKEVATLARMTDFYATHTRDRDERAVEAVAEAIRVGDEAETRLQISHLVPRSGLEETRRCVSLVEAARDKGQDVAFDMHTRTFGLTYLYTALPSWALSATPLRLTDILRDPVARARMRTHKSILSAGGDWSRVVLFDNPIWPDYARRDVVSIAQDRGQEPFDTVCDLLLGAVANLQDIMVLINAYSEQQQREAFTHPLCTPGSDATSLAPDGQLAHSFFHGAYSWASWFWHFLVSKEKLLSSAEAIHRLTGAPASRLGLSDRGVLRIGAKADVVVFDPAVFSDRATVFDPNQIAQGMQHVIVNGVHTLCDGVLTGNRAGVILRR